MMKKINKKVDSTQTRCVGCDAFMLYLEQRLHRIVSVAYRVLLYECPACESKTEIWNRIKDLSNNQ